MANRRVPDPVTKYQLAQARKTIREAETRYVELRTIALAIPRRAIDVRTGGLLRRVMLFEAADLRYFWTLTDRYEKENG